jgi:hypothetical protein
VYVHDTGRQTGGPEVRGSRRYVAGESAGHELDVARNKMLAERLARAKVHLRNAMVAADRLRQNDSVMRFEGGV